MLDSLNAANRLGVPFRVLHSAFCLLPCPPSVPGLYLNLSLNLILGPNLNPSLNLCLCLRNDGGSQSRRCSPASPDHPPPLGTGQSEIGNQITAKTAKVPDAEVTNHGCTARWGR